MVGFGFGGGVLGASRMARGERSSRSKDEVEHGEEMGEMDKSGADEGEDAAEEEDE